MLRLFMFAHLSGLLNCAGGAQTAPEKNEKSLPAPKSIVTLSYRMVPKGVTIEQIRAVSVHVKLFHGELLSTLGTPRHPLIPFTVYVYPDRRTLKEATSGLDGRWEGDFLHEKGTQKLHMALTREGLWGLGRFHVRVFLSAACRHFPPWVIEGFVEFYGTGLRQPGPAFGHPCFDLSKARRALLALRAGSLAAVLARPPGTELSPEQRVMAWALVYWLMRVVPKRNPQAKKRAFSRYLVQVMKKGPGVDFFKITGMSEETVVSRIVRWLERRTKQDAGK